jgi:hypothetical protein
VSSTPTTTKKKKKKKDRRKYGNNTVPVSCLFPWQGKVPEVWTGIEAGIESFHLFLVPVCPSWHEQIAKWV